MSHRLCTSPHCSVQPRHAAPGRNLCTPCRDQLADVLTVLADHYDDCAHELRLGWRRSGERVRGGMVGGIRLSDAILDVRADILSILTSWTAMTVQERGLPAPSRDVHAMTALLRRNIDWLAAHPAAGDFADEMTDLLACAREVVNPDRAPLLHLGPCPQPGCERPVHATVQTKDRTSRPVISCAAGHTYDADQWRALAA
jgi:hypothetical protein